MAKLPQEDSHAHEAVSSTRILAVDTASPYLQSLARRLREFGYRCDAVDDPRRGRQLILSEQYDLLVTDINLAGGEGVELIEHAQCNAPGLPVIVVTESPCLDSAIQSIELPVVAYLAKSAPPTILCEKIRGVLDNRKDRHTLTRVQRRLRACAADLNDVQIGESDSAYRDGSETSRVPLSTLQALAGCVGELVALETAASPERQVTRLCELLQCPVWRVQRNSLHKCILLLHETKRRFKSKELAQVRDILEGLLKSFR